MKWINESVGRGFGREGKCGKPGAHAVQLSTSKLSRDGLGKPSAGFLSDHGNYYVPVHFLTRA